MIALSALLDRAGVRSDAINGDATVTALAADSRLVTQGALFICMPSPSGDTHRFLPEAKAHGAVAAIAHTRAGYESAIAEGLAAVLIATDNLKFEEAVWRLCRTFYDSPSRDMQVIGVTGTN